MIGKKLRELLELRNIKQIQLANHIGISASRLSNYLSDKREPDLELLAKMARYLRVDLNYFSDNGFNSDIKLRENVTYEDVYEIEEESASDVTTEYKATDSNVSLPYLPINSKKRASKETFIPLHKIFLEGIKEPEINSVIFEITTGIGGEHFSQGDRIIATKFNSMEPTNGMVVFSTGRNGRCYKYIENDGTRVLISEDTKDMVFIDRDTNMDHYYIVIWVFKKK